MSWPVPSVADVGEAWSEVARLRRRAVAAGREAADRRRLTMGGTDPLHPRALGLAAAADFHEARAMEAAQRANQAARWAAELELRLELARGAPRCA